MLVKEDKQKIENYLDKIIAGLREDAKKYAFSGMSNQQIIDKVTNATVNKLTPESKMIMSSVYNMLSKKTLSGALYEDSENKARFYQADILKELTGHFVFDVPNHIDYEECKKEVDKLVVGGAVSVVGVGGVLSITLNSWMPICIAAVIAAIMAVVLSSKGKSANKEDIGGLITNYCDSVRISLIKWIENIEKYYDTRVAEIEEGMKA